MDVAAPTPEQHRLVNAHLPIIVYLLLEGVPVVAADFSLIPSLPVSTDAGIAFR